MEELPADSSSPAETHHHNLKETIYMIVIPWMNT